MNSVIRMLSAFALGTSFWVYIYIFFGKLLEVSLGTLRMVLINRGMRAVGAIIAFIEIMLWLLVASSVLAGFSTDFWKGIVYALAYALGNYLGSLLDDVLAFGLSHVQVIIPDQLTASLAAEQLRSKGFGVTLVDVRGMESGHTMLMMDMKRKRLNEVLQFLHQTQENCVITVSDIKTQHGGYLKRSGSTTRLHFPHR